MNLADLAHLAILDKRFCAVLLSGDLKLLDADFLREVGEVPRRMLRGRTSKTTSGGRAFASSCLPPRPSPHARRRPAHRLAELRMVLRGCAGPYQCLPQARAPFLRDLLGAHIKAVFWDYGSLCTRPFPRSRPPAALCRSSSHTTLCSCVPFAPPASTLALARWCAHTQSKARERRPDKSFRALSVMGDAYASALGVTVIRHKLIPPRPASFDGKLVLLPPKGLAPSEADASVVLSRVALADHGEVDVQASGDGRQWVVSYAQHSQAEAAVAALAEGLEAQGGAMFAQWNSRPYAERGWTTFESAVTTEVVARAAFFKKQRAALGRLPPKLIEIDDDDGPAVAEEADVERMAAATAAGVGGASVGAGPRIERVRAAIRDAAFTGKGDKDVVVGLYNEYMVKVGNAMNASGEGVAGTYEGERNEAGQYEGRGTFRFVSGNVYEGEWKAGKKEGRGTFRFASGDVYEGEWKANEREGRGTYRHASGDVYEGEYKADKREGRGTPAASEVCTRGSGRRTRWRARHVPLRQRRCVRGGVQGGQEGGARHVRYATAMELAQGRCSVGEAARWSADRQAAWRLQDGEVVEQISLEECEIAAKGWRARPRAEGAASRFVDWYAHVAHRIGVASLRHCDNVSVHRAAAALFSVRPCRVCVRCTVVTIPFSFYFYSTSTFYNTYTMGSYSKTAQQRMLLQGTSYRSQPGLLPHQAWLAVHGRRLHPMQVRTNLRVCARARVRRLVEVRCRVALAVARAQEGRAAFHALATVGRSGGGSGARFAASRSACRRSARARASETGARRHPRCERRWHRPTKSAHRRRRRRCRARRDPSAGAAAGGPSEGGAERAVGRVVEATTPPARAARR